MALVSILSPLPSERACGQRCTKRAFPACGRLRRVVPAGAVPATCIRTESIKDVKQLPELKRTTRTFKDAAQQSEAVLSKSEGWFRSVAEQSKIGIYLLHERKCIYLNDYCTKTIGYRAEEVYGWAPGEFFKIIHPDDRQAALAQYRQEFDQSGEDSRLLEFRALHPGGATKWVSILSKPVPYEDGLAILGILTDITERKKRENEQRAATEKYRHLVETSHDLIWSVDMQARWTFLNRQGTERIYGRAPIEMLGQKASQYVYSENREKDNVAFRRTLRGESLFDHRTVHVKKGGSLVWLSFNGMAVHDAEGNVVGAAGTARDITAQERAEEDRLRLEARMQQAQKMESLGILAGGIAHDFNNFLMAIQANAELALIELPQDSQAQKGVEKIFAAARGAAALAGQMLAYSGRGGLLPESASLDAILRGLAPGLEATAAKNTKIKCSVAETPAYITADISQIQQLISSLFTNANEALHDNPGEIVLAVGARQCDRETLDAMYLSEALPEGPYAFLEVSDTGCGMDESTVARVFDPFFTTKFTGRGLGLAAALGIARGHQGAIRVQSALGAGTTVTVVFPLAKAPTPQPKEAPKAPSKSGGDNTILIVDDERAVLAVGERVLEKLGYVPLAARSGEEAVRLYREHEYQIACILLDLTMPEMNGEQTFDALREISPDVPVILTSGFSEADITGRFAGKNIAGVLQKPYRIAELEEKIIRATRCEL